MKWFRNFRSRLGRRDVPPSLTAALFGKHPAFADHIESGIGTMTPALADFKQRFYNNGIKRLIDSGAWHDKPEERILDGFDHHVVVMTDTEMLVGRFWSSRDSRGRAEYPLVAVIEARAVPVRWALNHAGTVLADLRRDAMAADSEESLETACRTAQETLDAAMNALDDKDELTLAPRFSEIVEHFFADPAFGEQAIGLKRVLHRVDDAAAPRAKGVPAPTLQLRLPRSNEAPMRQLADWCIVLLEALPREHAVVGIAPDSGDWIDLLAGVPGYDEFYILRATPADVPLDSDTPYDLAPDIEVRWRQRTSSDLPDAT